MQTELSYEYNLIDPICNIYNRKDNILPPTSLTGRVPIDSIFVSPQLQNITRGGWINIEGQKGDHRSLYIDIPIIDLLGENPFHILRNSAKRLICDQPKIISKYNTELNQQLKLQKTFKKFNFLYMKIKEGTISDEYAIILLNEIDNSITNSVRYAEKRCRKLKYGSDPYIP